MACGRDFRCYTIATSIYPGLQGEIDGAIGSITGCISSITSSLNGLSIPDDYLGTKVKGRVNSICSSISGEADKVASIGAKIDGFIGQKIEEHMEHYRAWEAKKQSEKKPYNRSKTTIQKM